MFESDDDPRLTDDHIESVVLDDSLVTIIGVVHDHPASTYRAMETIRRRDPDVLALELPPLALSAFQEYADDIRRPPALGGEMSAAIQAASTEHVVGIDGPSGSFIRLLVRTLVHERAGTGTMRDVAEALAVATKSAVVSRVAGTIASVTPLRVEVGQPWEYAVDWTDRPAVQAEDEHDHLGRARALSSSLVPPAAKRIRDEVREEHMVERLTDAALAGDVVAVVGQDHLDPIATALDA